MFKDLKKLVMIASLFGVLGLAGFIFNKTFINKHKTTTSKSQTIPAEQVSELLPLNDDDISLDNTTNKSSHKFFIPIQDIKTNAGFSVWFVEKHKNPVISFSIAFKNGGVDPDDKPGLVSLLNTMLKKGCAGMSPQDYARYLVKNNIQLQFINTKEHFILQCRTFKKNLNEAFNLIEMVLSKPNFDAESFKIVKNQFLSSYEESKHNENMVANLELGKFTFENQSIIHTPDDFIQSLAKIQDIDLRNFMKDKFTQSEVLISAAGSIDWQEFSQYLDKVLTKLPKIGESKPLAQSDLKNLGKMTIVDFPIPQSVILFIQPGIERGHPDFYAAMLANEILGGSVFESRLWRKVRGEKGLTYGLNLDLQPDRIKPYILGEVGTKSANVIEVIDLIQKEWKNIAKNNITKRELNFVKQQLIGSYPLSFGSTMSIANKLISYRLLGLDKDHINQNIDKINKVTLEQVNKIASDLYKAEKLTFVIVGKGEELANVLKHFNPEHSSKNINENTSLNK